MFRNFLIIIFLLLLFSRPSLAQEEIFFQPIGVISVTGNKVFNDEELLNMITRNISTGQRINVNKIQEDLEEYYSTGYFSETTANYSLAREGVHLEYVLRENPVIAAVAITGNISLSGEYLLRLMKSQPGKVLNYQFLEQDIRKINQIYKDQGYDLSQVSNVFFDKEKRILYMRILEAKLGKIKLAGLENVREILLYREIGSKPGEVFNSQKLRRDRNRMLSTGLLGRVSSPLLDISKELGKVDIGFDVKERKTNQINFGYGLSSQEQFGFVKLTLLNFFHWGETMTLRMQSGYELGEVKQTYRYRFYTPWFLGRRMSFTYERYYKQHYEDLIINGEVIDFLEIKRDGWGMELGWLNADPLFISTEYYQEDVSEVVSNPSIRYSKKSVAMVFVYNTVKQDIYNNAASGEYGKLRLESGGLLGTYFGNELDLGGRTFGRYEMNYSRFLSFDLGKIVAIRTQTGIFNVAGEKPILEGEQYVVGGSNTVRGYLDIYPFAVGTRKFIINLEYRHTFSNWLQGVVFYDWGSAFDLGPVYFNQFRSGKGIGVRFGTPLGPIRFDWAFGEDYIDPLGKEHYHENMPRNVLHFSLGHTF